MFVPSSNWTRLVIAASVAVSALTLVNASVPTADRGQFVLQLDSNYHDDPDVEQEHFRLDSRITRWPLEKQALYGSDADLATNTDLRIWGFDAIRAVQFDSEFDPVNLSSSPIRWITEAEKLKLKAAGEELWDVTENPFRYNLSIPRPKFTYPSSPQANKTVNAIFPLLSTEEQQVNIAAFTDPIAHPTRYYNSEWGRNSSIWLARKVAGYVEKLGGYEEEGELKIEVVRWEHRWLQDSLVVRLTPSNASSTDPITIIGAHADSINKENPLFPAPGADDDGSGTVTILEALRALLAAKYIPKSPLEFHFYAGEEGGLLGSQAIVAEYQKAGKVIRGMQQFDTIAWIKAGVPEKIGIIMSTVDEALTDFQIMLIEAYLDIPWIKSKYPGRASSDHASWHKANYPTCHVTENAFEDMNFNLHSPYDRTDVPGYSFQHMLKFTKLAVAFAVEMTS